MDWSRLIKESAMNRVRLALGIIVALTGCCAVADEPAKEDPVAKAVAALYQGIREEWLPNGLRVYLKPIAGAPTVTVMTAYKVGSADEEMDHTGLAHYLEHLMFKGTDKLMPGEIDRQTRRAGGQNNAYTTYDFTNFHFDFASDRWEVALQIEADRMRSLRIDEKHEFQQEKGAVIQELDGNEDQPYELENKAILPLLFGKNTPYGHPIIGEKKHVRGATAEVIKGYYDRWYHPNNAVMVIVGGFDADEAMTKIRALFGSIPEGKLPTRKSVAAVSRDKPVKVEIPSKFEVDRFVMGFNTCVVGDADDYVLDVIQYLLTSGKTGRLYRKLVLEEEVAGEVNCQNQAGRLPGWFSIELEVMKGVHRDKAESELLHELKRLASEPISPDEMKRVLRTVTASMIFDREDVHKLADSMAQAAATTGMEYQKKYLQKLQAVTAADVQRVAKKYLDPDKRVVVFSVAPPKKDAAPLAASRSRHGSRRLTHYPSTTPQAAKEPPAKSAAGAAAIDLRKAKRTVLDNGLTLVTLENRRLPIIYAEAHVAKVRLYEPADKNGVAALVGLLLEEGTDKRSEKEIAHTIEDVGGVLQMSASGGEVKVLTPDRSLGLGLMLECLTRPAFKRESVKRLKEHQLSEIEDRRQQPPSRAQDEFLALIYGDHPLGRPPLGTEDSVDGLNASACRDFHHKVFVPNNTVLVVVGDFDTQAIVDEVKALTKEWKRQDLPKVTIPTPKPPEKPIEKIVPLADSVQLNVYMGHLGIRRNDPDYYKLLVMDNILGVGTGFTDRLSSKLRDRQGLAYTVTASITATAGEERGIFSAYIGTDPREFGKVKSMIREEIDRIRAEKPTAREVEESKDFLLGTLAFRLETNKDLADQLVLIERHKLGLDYLETFRRQVGAVTAEDVYEVARKHLHPDRLVLVAAGPVNESGEPLKKDEGGQR
jgi:zinc protease